MTHLERLYAALWVSEVWNLAWHERGHIHYKARAVVVFDRVFNMADGVDSEPCRAKMRRSNPRKGQHMRLNPATPERILCILVILLSVIMLVVTW